jgi:hypothetical protein
MGGKMFGSAGKHWQSQWHPPRIDIGQGKLAIALAM